MPTVVAMFHIERSQDVTRVIEEVRRSMAEQGLPARLEVNHVRMKTHKAKAGRLTLAARRAK